MHILEFVPDTIDRLAEAIAGDNGFLSWLVHALGGAVAGLIVGGIIVAIVRQFTKHPEDLVVDL
jgi:predicted DNA repair protein MutK